MEEFTFEAAATLLKKHRKTTGLSQKDYAKKAGVPLRTYSNMERAIKTDILSISKALKYAGYYVSIISKGL